MTKIIKMRLHLLQLCRENCGLLFSGHGIMYLKMLFFLLTWKHYETNTKNNKNYSEVMVELLGMVLKTLPIGLELEWAGRNSKRVDKSGVRCDVSLRCGDGLFCTVLMLFYVGLLLRSRTCRCAGLFFAKLYKVKSSTFIKVKVKEVYSC